LTLNISETVQGTDTVTVLPPGSAGMVCLRPSLMTCDRLTLKLVCELHLRWERFFQIWAR